MQKISYTIKDEKGIHARPAGLLVKEAAKLKSDITINVGGKSADLKRLLAVMSLGVKKGDEIEILLDGPDELAAAAELLSFLEANL